MEYPIVQVETNDGVNLFGMHLEAPRRDTCFLFTHGTASNFYEEDFFTELSKKLLAEDISVLSVNNRGAGVYDAYERTGAAVELFEDCIRDLDAWILFAVGLGYRAIVLSGHSLGAEKVVYYMGCGVHRNRVSAVVLFAPADSYGSHRIIDGKSNPRAGDVERLLLESGRLIAQGEKDTFLSRNAYGSHDGIMPKSAESFVNFLGPNSKLLEALPYATRKLSTFARIMVPVLVLIGDGTEYTAIPVPEALALMERENSRARVVQLSSCDHDFNGKEKEVVEKVLSFLREVLRS